MNEETKFYIPEAELEYLQNLVLQQTESTTSKYQNLIDPVRIVNKDDVKTGATAPPELREYLICYIYWDEEDAIHKEFEAIIGRKEAYEWVKQTIVDCNIDIKESKVFTENVTISEGISVYEFMKYMEGFYEDVEFDIDDYNN